MKYKLFGTYLNDLSGMGDDLEDLRDDLLQEGALPLKLKPKLRKQLELAIGSIDAAIRLIEKIK